MILQQLYNDADAILRQTRGEELPPSMYVPKKIRWIIELNGEEAVQFSPLTGDDKKGERGLEMLVPSMKRAAGVRPLLFADKTSYALGIRVPDAKLDAGRDLEKDAIRTTEEFESFRNLVRKCAEKTGEPDVTRILEFLETWDPQNPPANLPSDLSRDNFFTFRVDGRLIVNNPKVRQFWAAYGQAEEEEQDTTAQMQCLVSGARGAIEEMMPLPVKGLPGGKAEMAIVSANAAAFESYGLKRAQTSPISRDAGERFGQALNALLASQSHHAQVQSATYVFWSPAGQVRLALFDPKEAQEFLTAVRSGKRHYQTPPEAAFHLFGLTANAARVAVRSAIDTTVGEIEQRQKEWFQRLRIIGFDEAGKLEWDRAYPVKHLAVSAYRDFKDIIPGVEDALVRAALVGEKLPVSLLNALVNRCRAERKITHTRAALIKYILTQDQTEKEAESMTQESTTPRPPGLEDRPDDARAYHLGRLFAELEMVQSQAIPGLNATIADRFYGSASSTPAAVFGTLLDGVQNHLAKLRKEKEGAWGGAQKRLEEITLCIDKFPNTLPLRSQAYFSLGYYHHRAARRQAAMEASAKKKAQGAENTTTVTTDLSNDPAYAVGEPNDY